MKIISSLCLIIACLSQASQAELIRGIILKTKKGTYLKTGENSQFKILFNNRHVAQDVSKLSSKDFLEGNGFFLKKRQAVVLQGIDFVGLNAILGQWISQRSELFNFHDYSHVEILRPIGVNQTEFPLQFSLIYSVTPDSGSQWSIIFVNGEGVDVGRLVLGEEQMTIEILDRETSEVRRIFKLSPFARKEPVD